MPPPHLQQLPHEQRGQPALVLAVAHEGVSLHHAARSTERQGCCQLGRRLRQHACRCARAHGEGGLGGKGGLCRVGVMRWVRLGAGLQPRRGLRVPGRPGSRDDAPPPPPRPPPPTWRVAHGNAPLGGLVHFDVVVAHRVVAVGAPTRRFEGLEQLAAPVLW